MTISSYSSGTKTSGQVISFRAGLYAVLALVIYGLSWYYNGQLIPLLAAGSIVLMIWGAIVWWPCLRAGLIWPRGFLPIFMLLWFVWFGLTLFWSGSPYSSWFYFWVLGALPLTFLVAIMIPEPVAEQFWVWFWRGILISAWILSAMALWQYYQGMATNIILANLRPFGPLLDTNSFAAWLNLLFFPVLALYFVKDGRRQVSFLRGGVHLEAFFYLLTLAVLLLAFFSTSSRGGLLAWVCTMPFAVWGLWRQPAARSRFLVVTALVIIAFLLMDYAHGYDLIGHLSPGYITSNITTVSRKLMWIATWHMYLSHPWLGTGIGSYFLNYPAYRLPGELASAGTYAHNDYLEYLAEGGLINLGFLLSFAGILMYAMYRLLYRAGKALQISDEQRLTALGLVLGVFAITGHALGNFIFYNLPLSVLAGLFMARAWRIYGTSENTQPLLPKIGINHGFIAQLVLLLGIVVASWNLLADAATYAFLSDNTWLNSVIKNPRQRTTLLLKVADTLTSLRPLATQPHVYLANTYLTLAERDTRMNSASRRSLVQAALHQYQQSLIGIPQQSGVLNSIGTLYLTQGKLLGLDATQRQRQTLLAWRRGLAIDPESISLRNQIAQLAYADQGDVKGGLTFLRAGLARPLFPYPRSELLLDIALMQWRADEKTDAEKTLLRLLHENPAYEPAVSWLQSIHRQAELHSGDR
ncbi:O-antigen ligase family protein [Acidithiobacillus thiooxidans]|uniref:O-antigen ligase family protein n=1 Tax=Acidithiobacillus thiooxidans TaxID=930 RepID=UPI002863C2FE|nr:O-antigen ligase family protein [Acidithiobacillus thiooxidans]MDR7928397.1 O-antigen ligase family protein [Acidithiobacillus thiooxidans]